MKEDFLQYDSGGIDVVLLNSSDNKREGLDGWLVECG